MAAAPIGRPIGNTRALRDGRRAAAAASQQRGRVLHRRGGVARGYVNQEELTKERFVTDRSAKRREGVQDRRPGKVDGERGVGVHGATR